MDASNTIVRVENLVKDFRPGLGLRRKRVLHGISFEVQEGEIFGFVGPNGPLRAVSQGASPREA